MLNEEKEICLRIRELRKQIGLNQSDFGKRIEVAQGYLTNIETAKRPATEKILKLICLQEWDGKIVNEVWLRTGKGEMFVELSQDMQLMSWAGKVLAERPESFKRRLVTVLSNLSEAEWELLEKRAYQLLGVNTPENES